MQPAVSDSQCQDLFLAFFKLRCCLSACDVRNMVQWYNIVLLNDEVSLSC